jgi:hypothetical protein
MIITKGRRIIFDAFLSQKKTFDILCCSLGRLMMITHFLTRATFDHTKENFSK